MSLWPTLLFSNLSISSRKITVSHQPFSVLTDFNNFFTLNFSLQFLPTIFSQISTDLLRSSQVYLAIQPLFLIYLAISKIFQNFPSFIPFLLGAWTVGHSGPLSSFPQIFTDLHRFILPFTLYLSIIYPLLCLQDLHRSSTDLSKIFQKFPFLHPLPLGPGQSVIPAHSSDLQAFRFPPFF